MNIILFCRIVYIDMEIFKPIKIPEEISKEKPSDIQHDNIETLDEQITNNLTPTNLCARDTVIEDTANSNSNHDDIGNNQNYVNGCQKRAQWAEENLVID